MFEDTKARFDDYYRLLDRQNAPGFIRDLGSEVGERLQQLDYIIRRVKASEQTAEAAFARSSKMFHDHVERVIAAGLGYNQKTAPGGGEGPGEEGRAEFRGTLREKIFNEGLHLFSG